MNKDEIIAGLRQVQAVVNKQAEDDGLWFIAQYASEGYLQAQLRALHAIIEDSLPAIIAAVEALDSTTNEKFAEWRESQAPHGGW